MVITRIVTSVRAHVYDNNDMEEQIQYTGPNQGIWDYLNEYVLNPDPQYAVFINGNWGCGKTFFVKNWIVYYNGLSAQEDRTLRPIYVSLYGVRQTSQITAGSYRS